MEKKKRQGAFKEVEKVYALPTRKGEELRFCVVEVDGKARADIRYFSEGDQGVRPTPRGILVHPKRLADIEEGVRRLSEKFSKK